MSKQIGIIVSYVDGVFEDVGFVDFNTLTTTSTPETTSIIRRIRSTNMKFSTFASSLEENYQGKVLGNDYDDTPGCKDTLYGPFDAVSLHNLRTYLTS